MNVEVLEKKRFLFITGIEGSGTTMMLKILDALQGVAVLGGNYHTPELSGQAAIINDATERMWNSEVPVTDEQKETCLSKIRNISIPDKYSTVVYKRSFPFIDRVHFPILEDIRRVSKDFKLLVMRRSLEANTRSILRRQFESDNGEAQERTRRAHSMLSDQLSAWDYGRWMEIAYEDIIDENRKGDILTEFAGFIEISPTLLIVQGKNITGPTIGK